MRKRPALLATLGFALVVVVIAAPDPLELTSRLGDSSARRRDDAARELVGLGRAAVPALQAAADSTDLAVRTRARAILELVSDDAAAGIRERQALDAVRDALRMPHGLDEGSELDARVGALAPESSRALAAAARRIAARSFLPRTLAVALARHAGAETLAALAEFARDERIFPSTGLAAAREIDRQFAADPERAARVRREAAPALAPLIQAMDSFHAPTRRMAVALYGALASEEGGTRMTAVFDSDPGVRVEVARVMGLYAPASSASSLRRLAVDADPNVREAALTALLAVPGVPHPEPAVAASTDASPAVRAAAARLLARDATPETLPVLEALAVDPSDRVRAAARRALARLRG